MKIALTKKLADAVGVKNSFVQEENENVLFSWTANWTNVWSNRKAEDMIVMVNNATRFTIAIYEVKKKDLKNLEMILKNAIANALLFININPEIVEEYMRLAGDIELGKNTGRQTASWVAHAGSECSFYVGRQYNGISKMFSDTVGSPLNYRMVNYSKGMDESFTPFQKMIDALTELTGKPAYKYRAFELKVTLDLDEYKAVRRIIVAADLSFERLHQLLQNIFNWRGYHLFDFFVHRGDRYGTGIRIVPDKEFLEYDEDAVLMDKHILSDFLPEYKHICYTYDMGDNWKHDIELTGVIEDYDKESPYLVEAIGQTPPEDVGGVPGYLEFRKIMLNPNHPEHEEMKDWAGIWSPELSDWYKGPKVVRFWF